MSKPAIDLKDPRYHAIRNFRVLRFVDKGRRANVFKVVDPASGGIYALKVARDDTEERLSQALRSFTSESKKGAAYKELGVAHSAIIQFHTLFIVKEWVEGIRGDAWVKKWATERSPYDSVAARKLRKLVRRLAKKGVYIGDLTSKNLIWVPPFGGITAPPSRILRDIPPLARQEPGQATTKKGWVIVDSGSITNQLSFEEAMTRYVTNIPERWGKYGDAETTRKLKRLFDQQDQR